MSAPPRQLLERTLTDSEQVLGDTHPNTLPSRNNLARASQDAGRLDEAEGLRNRAEPESRLSRVRAHGICDSRTSTRIMPADDPLMPAT